jgi:hypothetical protein
LAHAARREGVRRRGHGNRRLARWVNTDLPVRISGWLLLDPEHRAHLGKYRSTLWEIHPITRIEVFDGKNWIDLDD